MKFFVSIILIALLSFAACLYLPWWSIAIAAFIVALLIKQKAWPSFAAGFLALFILWTALSYSISLDNNHIMASKVAMLVINMDSPVLLTLVTGLLGGLVAGFGAMTASFIQKKKA